MKNIKKIITTLTFALLLIFTITGCSSSKTSSDEQTSIDKIKAEGKIKIGTNSGYPPYEFYITNGGKKQLAGYDIDIANAIAKDLGVEVEWVDTDFDSLVPSLLTKKFDIILAGMIATDERKQSIDFSQEYYSSKTVAVTYKDKIADLSSAKNLAGKKIVAQTGTTQATAGQSIKGATVNEIGAVPDTVASVLSGQNDVLFVAEVVAKSIVAQNPELAYHKIDGIDDKLLQDGAAVGIYKGDQSMKDEVDKVISQLKKSGELDKMFLKNKDLADQQ